MPRKKPLSKAAAQKKVGVVMKEFKEGKLKSGGSGKMVTSVKQAIAIAISEAKLSKKKKDEIGPKKKSIKKSTKIPMKKRKK